MQIPIGIIEELRSAGLHGVISDPDKSYLVATLSGEIAITINALSREVHITRRALKHIIDSRKESANEVVSLMPLVIQEPDKIADNHRKRQGSFLFVKILYKNFAVVLETTKTTGLSNQVVSAFFVDRKTYEKIHDISGRSAFLECEEDPSFSTLLELPDDGEISS